MKVDVIMPQMGESIAEGTLTKWLKKPGDKVARDEPIFEISTDKVDAEIPAPAAGVLAEVKVKEGETVPINTVVALIETEAGAAAGKAAAAKPAAAKAEPARPEPAKTEPAPRAARTPEAGERPAPPAPAGRAAAGARAAGDGGGVPRAADLAAAGAGVEEIRRVRSSPVVRKIAREHNIDLAGLEGSGIAGRVTKKDILAMVGAGAAGAGPGRPAAERPTPVPPPPRPAFAPGERTVVEPMSVMRRRIAEHMVQSKRTSAHVTSVFEVDLHRVQRLRARHQEEFQKRHGVRLTVTPFFVKAAVEALKTFPKLNASIDGDRVVYRKDINIGVAVALDWGLIVPVVRNAEDRTISGLAKAIADLAERARAKKLTPEEVQGGTFTITNPGPEGALIATPIINQPQVAILGVGSINKRPVVVDDAIAVRPVVFLSLSWDHRLIDGVDADRFMTHIKRTLEEANFPEIL